MSELEYTSNVLTTNVVKELKIPQDLPGVRAELAALTSQVIRALPQEQKGLGLFRHRMLCIMEMLLQNGVTLQQSDRFSARDAGLLDLVAGYMENIRLEAQNRNSEVSDAALSAIASQLRKFADELDQRNNTTQE